MIAHEANRLHQPGVSQELRPPQRLFRANAVKRRHAFVERRAVHVLGGDVGIFLLTVKRHMQTPAILGVEVTEGSCGDHQCP